MVDAGGSLEPQGRLRLPKEGKGEGKAIPYAQLTFNKDTNILEIENYQREPVRLNEITVLEPKR